jgi:hypothetical protein
MHWFEWVDDILHLLESVWMNISSWNKVKQEPKSEILRMALTERISFIHVGVECKNSLYPSSVIWDVYATRICRNARRELGSEDRLPVIIRIYVVDIRIQCVFSFQVSDTTWVGADGLEE